MGESLSLAFYPRAAQVSVNPERVEPSQREHKAHISSELGLQLERF